MLHKNSQHLRRTKIILVSCLVALLTAGALPIQAAETGTTEGAAGLKSPGALETDEEIQVMTPFEVAGEKDYGYLKTNAATATRIGMEIQKVPMNVQVLSKEFLEDTNARSLTDLFRYTASGSGDGRFAMRVPANEATPQGGFTLRGFTVNTILRNGVFRYLSYNLDNVERVEIVKGPAAVFFGQGYPGGVINYITKRPSFTAIPNTFSYQINDSTGTKVTIDTNVILSKHAAFRVVGAWEDTQGDRQYEFRKNINITPSLTLIPFDSGKLKINVEAEYLKEKYNENDYDWIYPTSWFEAYANPSAELIAASGVADADAYRTRIKGSVSNYMKDVRAATGDYTLPAYTSIQRGAYYTDANGNRVYDENFNYTSRGAYTENEVKTFSTTVDLAPFEWLDARYSYTNDNSTYNAIRGITTPYADGIHYNVSAQDISGYYRQTQTHQLDLIFKFDLFGVKSTVLTGYTRSKYLQQYMAKDSDQPDYSQVPTTIRDRDGNIKTQTEVFTNWDPGYEISPDISRVLLVTRSALDGYKPEIYAYYVNYQAAMLDDRLNLIAGYREEHKSEAGQFLISNYPWYIVPETAYLDTTTYPESEYGYTASYAATNFYSQKGDSWMGGASFAITKNINLYSSVSKTFKFNTGTVGGLTLGLDDTELYQAALDHGGGSYEYLGQTITSVAQAQAVAAARGVYDQIQNEEGMNYEVGAKIFTDDSKFVATFSVFRAERTNQKLDDSIMQQNAQEPYNYSTDLFDSDSAYYNKRNLRWRTTNLKNRIEGAEIETVWTPMPNYQAVINGSWLWTAKSLYAANYAKPGTAAYEALSATAKVNSDIYYGARIENVPEYRVNLFNKYTFSDGPMRGVALGLGARYSSETVISRTVDYNPLNGGLMGGNYVVYDFTVRYPWKILNYRLKTSFGIYNVLDKEYIEGAGTNGATIAEGRNWVLTNTLTF